MEGGEVKPTFCLSWASTESAFISSCLAWTRRRQISFSRSPSTPSSFSSALKSKNKEAGVTFVRAFVSCECLTPPTLVNQAQESTYTSCVITTLSTVQWNWLTGKVNSQYWPEFPWTSTVLQPTWVAIWSILEAIKGHTSLISCEGYESQGNCGAR